MNHRYRPRTGTRRDGQVRPIRSNHVRYPGTNIPGTDSEEYRRWREGGRSLRPALDTGLALEGRVARERRRRAKRQQWQLAAGIVAVAVLAVAFASWRYSSDKKAAAQPLPVAEKSQGSSRQAPVRRSSGADPSVAQIRAMVPKPDPTPIFARYKDLDIRLPVSVKDLTEVGFHQAAYTYALHMTTPLSTADGDKAKADKSTHRDKSKQAAGANAVLCGSCLRMWRSRPGKPDSAADVGAQSGSSVYAPVSGTVIKIKRYKLYGQHDDYELHIKPTGLKGVDVVMIHITDLRVAVGDKVEGGITKIASVRRLGDRVNHQLRDYAKYDGDHVHVQLNNTRDPEYKGLQGAITVGES